MKLHLTPTKGSEALNHLGGYSQYLGNQGTIEELIKNVDIFFSPEENVVYGFFKIKKIIYYILFRTEK